MKTRIMFVWLVLLTISEGFLYYRVWEMSQDIEDIKQAIETIMESL